MKKLLIPLAMLSANVYAQPYLVTEPSLNAKHYTPVVVVTKKLRTTLVAARAQFPGEEYLVSVDTGAALTKPPALFNGLYTYNNVTSNFEGFLSAPRIDGLKTTGVANFIVTETTLSPSYPVNVSFTQPSKEFGVFLATSTNSGNVFTDSVLVAVDGVELGVVSLPANTSTYVGVRDDEAGLYGHKVTYTPAISNTPEAIAPFVSDSFYLE